MGSTEDMISKAPTRLVLTRIPDTWAWMRQDLLIRILPFALVFTAAYVLAPRPTWLGLTLGRVTDQLIFGLAAAPVMFVAAMLVKLLLARRRGALSLPAGGSDAWFQAGFYALNGPVEEAFFRGLVQGGLGAAFGAPVGFLIGTGAYVLYHRLGWPWIETLATALVGVPLGLAFWLLPGPPSLLGVSIAHVAATCGFLGPGPYLLKKLKLV
jgi:membrane protease YdiL (CAAX protease family)